MLLVKHMFPRNALRAWVFSLLSVVLSPLGAWAAAAATTTTLTITSGTSTAKVTSVASGTAVTLTATVKAGATLVKAGTVLFCDASAAHCTDIHVLGTGLIGTAGTAAFKFVPGPGAHSYKAEFTGTVNDSASSSAASSLTVEAVPTTAAIASSGSAGNYTLKATVTGANGAAGPTGEVSFVDTSAAKAVLATAALGASTKSTKWTTPPSPATSPEPQSIVVADFNGDGYADIAIGTNGTAATKNVGYLNIFLGNGNGTFQAAKTFVALGNNGAMVAAPFVTGGPMDVLTVDNNATGTNNAALFLGDGKGGGTLQTPFSLGGLANVTAVAAGDFNRDGSEDFVITGIIYGVYCFAPVLGNGNGTFGGPTLNAVGNDPLLVAVGAFNSNGYPDIAVTDTGVGQVTLFQNNSQGYFFPEGQANTGTHPTAMVTGDFNGDGFLDIAVANGGSDNVTILLGKGNETLTAGSQSPATGHKPAAMAVGDFNGDGIADLAVANSGSDTVTVLLGNGNGTFTAQPDLDTGSTPLGLATGAFHAGISSDLALPNEDPTATAGSTATILESQVTQTAVATATGVNPAGATTHQVEASYAGDTIYKASVSATIPLTGTAGPAATPILSPAAGTYATVQTVTITDSTSGAAIYYTTNGTAPTTSSPRYTVPFQVATTETVEAMAIAAGHSESIVASAKYVIETPAAAPTFSPAAGTYTAAQSVKLTSVTTGAVIYYTTNGAAPTTSSTKYSAAIAVTGSKTIKAIAVAAGHANSAVASAAYTIVTPAAKPTFSVASGTYSSAQAVQLFDATPGATIYYTTNGATPTPASAMYKSAVSITQTGYLQAIAIANGYTASAVASALYSIGADVTATPVLTPAPGAYGTAQTVTITDATAGATITYSVGIGTTVNTYTYTGPFKVSSTEYIAYDAIAPGYTRSAALEGIYTIGTVPAPQFSPVAGSYATAQAVNIYDITPGAKIYYTTDGTAPTTSSAIYTSPVIVAGNKTLRALALVSGLTSSAPASSAYVIGKGTATPVFSLAPGSYTSAQKVTITDITPAATIYYTTNGAAPTTASTKYTGAISVAATETLKAIAVATGDTNSAIASAAYTIGYPIETVVVTASGTDLLTLPVGGSGSFAVATENQSGTSYPSVTVKTTTGSNSSLPVQVTLCQTNPSSGQCLTAPGATVTVSPFAAGAKPTFSVFVTATAAIASSPSNEIVVLFTYPSGTVLGSGSVLVATN